VGGEVVFAFGAFVLDPHRFELRRNGEAVHIEPRVFDVLLYLVTHRDRVVPRTELLDQVWGDRFVTESALTTRLKAARRAVGDDGGRQAVIRTVVSRGYQFVASVTAVESPGTSDPIEGASTSSGAPPAIVSTVPAIQQTTQPRTSSPPQQIRYCHAADGIRLAYASSGHHPPLVKVANWMTHLDLEWTSPVWAHWLEEMSSRHRLIRYDERGSGCRTGTSGPSASTTGWRISAR
jgi:DNA-binding winged helix-turn-helix (wHTH) protein